MCSSKSFKKYLNQFAVELYKKYKKIISECNVIVLMSKQCWNKIKICFEEIDIFQKGYKVSLRSQLSSRYIKNILEGAFRWITQD